MVRWSRCSQLTAAQKEIDGLREQSQSTALTSSVAGEPVATTLNRLREERDDTLEERRLAEEKCRELADELESAQDAEDRLSEIEAVWSELQQQSDELEREKEELVYDMKGLEQALADTERQRVALDEQRSELEEQNRELQEKIQELEAGTRSESDEDSLPPAPEPEQLEELERLRAQNQELKTQVEQLTEKNKWEEEARLQQKQEAQTHRSLAAGAIRREEEALQEKARVEKDNERMQDRLQDMLEQSKRLFVLEQHRLGTEIDALERSASSETTTLTASTGGVLPEPEPHTDTLLDQDDEMRHKLAELKEAKRQLQQLEEASREMQARIQELRPRRA